MDIQPSDVDRIATALHAKLRHEREANWIEPETHAEQHRFITEWLEERRRRHESWRRIKESVIGWIIITCIGGLFFAAGIGVYNWLAQRLQ